MNTSLSFETLFSQKGVATGGSDNKVNFWQFELINDTKHESKAKILTVLHSRTLNVEDSVLCVKITPDNRFVAVALLDSTVKIFFLDSFKVRIASSKNCYYLQTYPLIFAHSLQFWMSLYGHKLPVLCMAVSSDATLIATGSSDRNIKVWGLDHGNTHASIFAHDDSVTGISFIPNTHCFFSCGKDGKVKEWDGDKFRKIITLQVFFLLEIIRQTL